MKYLFIILAIILTVTGATLYSLWPPAQKNNNDVLITINGHDISRTDILPNRSQSSHHQSTVDFLDSIITKELLINEAQRQGIDKEEIFRKELKDYYEQSLIKILMDRENALHKVTVNDQEVNQYLDQFGKTFNFLQMKSQDLPSADDIRKNGTPHTSRFDDLSESLQLTLAGLKPGETTMEYETGNENYAILLDHIEGSAHRPEALTPNQVRKMLEEQKRRQQINTWIGELKKKASIIIHQ